MIGFCRSKYKEIEFKQGFNSSVLGGIKFCNFAADLIIYMLQF